MADFVQKLKKYWKSEKDKPNVTVIISPYQGTAPQYTGAGPSGQSAGMVPTANGPAQVHRDETMVQTGPRTISVIPSDGMAGPPMQGQGMRKGGSVPIGGYALGGSFNTNDDLMRDINRAETRVERPPPVVGNTIGGVTLPNYGAAAATSTPPAPAPVIDNRDISRTEGVDLAQQAQRGSTYTANIAALKATQAAEKPPAPTTASEYAQQGMNIYSNIAAGNDPYANIVEDQAKDDIMSKASATTQGAMQRAATIPGMTPGAVAAMGAEGMMGATADIADLSGRMAELRFGRQGQAAGSLISGAETLQTLDAGAIDAWNTAKGTTADTIIAKYTAAKGDAKWVSEGWKSDLDVVQALQAQWEANPANAGIPFNINDPTIGAWAQSQIDTLTTGSDAAIATQVRSSDAYINAPNLGAGVYYTPDGKATKAFYDEVFIPWRSQSQLLGGDLQVDFRYDPETNSMTIVDTATGEALVTFSETGEITTPAGVPDGDGDATPDGAISTPDAPTIELGDTGGAPTAMRPADFTAALEEALPGAGSDESMSTAWLKANGTRMPTNYEEWDNFNTNVRVYDPSVSSDMEDAAAFLGVSDTNMVAEYMHSNATNDAATGTLPSKDDFLAWQASEPRLQISNLYSTGVRMLTPISPNNTMTVFEGSEIGKMSSIGDMAMPWIDAASINAAITSIRTDPFSIQMVGALGDEVQDYVPVIFNSDPQKRVYIPFTSPGGVVNYYNPDSGNVMIDNSAKPKAADSVRISQDAEDRVVRSLISGKSVLNT